jgi:hypothetical protein
MPRELSIHHADVDEKTNAALWRFTHKLAAGITYFGDRNTPAGDWSPFFPGDADAIQAVLAHTAGNTEPHLALFAALVELYKIPQEVLNRFTGRHLDFYFREVLRLDKKKALPDRVHLLLALKKKALPITIGPDHLFWAGKDAIGKELFYAPSRTTVINAARVASLRSLRIDDTGPGRVLAAPVANSADGLGAPLDPAAPRWHPFGHAGLPTAQIGFALAAPVLRMREGRRTVTVTLTLGTLKAAEVNAAPLKQAFELFITGENGWLGPYQPDPLTLTKGAGQNPILQFSFTIAASEKAVTDYDQKLHGGAYRALAPVVQVVLKGTGAAIGYHDLQRITLRQAAISVEVADIRSLALENDGGSLDANKAFLPFGNQPTAGARFRVGCEEALAKKLSELKLTIQWQNAPADLADHYAGYGRRVSGNRHFTAHVAFADGGSWQLDRSGVSLFAADNAASPQAFNFSPGNASVSPGISRTMRIQALKRSGRHWAAREAQAQGLRKPHQPVASHPATETRQGLITFVLEQDFLHTVYRKRYVEQVLAFSKQRQGTLHLINEPYTPAIQTLRLAYQATSDTVDISAAAGQRLPLDAFANPDLHFFHLAPFGQMREHGYQREQFGFLQEKNVPLLPAYPDAGELLIGLEQLQASDSVSMLFQAAEGSADPELPQQPVQWSVLCDNYWKPLASSEVVLDTTNMLLTSGIITFAIPREATTDNTVLPAGLLWLKAAVARNVDAVSQLIEVAANAIEARFVDQDNDPAHLASALAGGSISKLKNGSTEIKTISQPYASFGGRATESDESFHTRVAERLRHKNRCITPWDYERIILEEFPKVHKVKCIPHATRECWLAPGKVLIVVVPDLRNSNGVDILQPKMDTDTLSRIALHVGKHAGHQVQVQVANPRYQPIHLDFKVRFHTGFEFNYYSKELHKALIRFLSPWAYAGTGRDIAFGGRVYKSVLLDFVEELAWVDFVEEFKMYTLPTATALAIDRNEAQPETPDAILVSAVSHRIGEA